MSQLGQRMMTAALKGGSVHIFDNELKLFSEIDRKVTIAGFISKLVSNNIYTSHDCAGAFWILERLFSISDINYVNYDELCLIFCACYSLSFVWFNDLDRGLTLSRLAELAGVKTGTDKMLGLKLGVWGMMNHNIAVCVTCNRFKALISECKWTKRYRFESIAQLNVI
jgi:hypothetical protein